MILMKKIEQIRSTIACIDYESFQLDITLKINYYALKSINYIHLGELDKAYKAANQSEKFILKAASTCFFTFYGYVFSITTYIILYYIVIKEPLMWNNGTNKVKLAAKVVKLLQYLDKFSLVFPFARCRYLLCLGIFETITDKNVKGIEKWKEGLESCNELGLFYDYLLLNHRIQSVENNKEEDLSMDIFSQLGIDDTDVSVFDEDKILCKLNDMT